MTDDQMTYTDAIATLCESVRMLLAFAFSDAMDRKDTRVADEFASLLKQFVQAETVLRIEAELRRERLERGAAA